MGNSATSPHESDDFVEFDGVDTLGYRVLGVQPNSPASKAGLVSFFDFVLGANGLMLLGSGEGLAEGEEYDDVDFPALLQENKGKVVELLVWNIKAQQKRLVELTPSDDWDGAGLLGVTIKLDNYGGADERLIRVLDVEKGSPASIAGLVKDKDFMLGTTTQNFVSSATLAAVLEDNIDQVVEIYVYSSDSDIVRVVALVPTLSWGGAGLLGAEVGTGYLHRLPNSCRSTTGQSVERKVRWTNQNNGGGQATDSGIVEMEPHLEMEVEKDEVTGRTRQPHELGRSESPAVQKAKDAVDCQVPNSDRTNAPTLDELADNTRCLQVECEARIKADANSSAVSSARPLEPQIHQDEMRQMPAPPKMSY